MGGGEGQGGVVKEETQKPERENLEDGSSWWQSGELLCVGDGGTDKPQEAELERLKMVDFSLGITRMEKFRNK